MKKRTGNDIPLYFSKEQLGDFTDSASSNFLLSPSGMGFAAKLVALAVALFLLTGGFAAAGLAPVSYGNPSLCSDLTYHLHLSLAIAIGSFSCG